MTARNDITGDAIATGKTTDAYRTGWDRIFKRKTKPAEAPETWYGCGECDCSFSCHNGLTACIRNVVDTSQDRN